MKKIFFKLLLLYVNFIILVFSRKEIRANNLFNVADCKIHWQKAGDYLCVKVDRYAKIKREKGDVKYSVRIYLIFHNL